MSAALGTGALNGLGFGSYDGLKPLEIEGIKMRLEGMEIGLGFFLHPLSLVILLTRGAWGKALRMGFE
jgi:hypothetical protein